MRGGDRSRKATTRSLIKLAHHIFNGLADLDRLAKGGVEFLARLFVVERERHRFRFPHGQFVRLARRK